MKTFNGKTRCFIMVSDKLDGSDFNEDDESLLTHLAGIGALGTCHAECLADRGR